jgi:hypothetical protein
LCFDLEGVDAVRAREKSEGILAAAGYLAWLVLGGSSKVVGRHTFRVIVIPSFKLLPASKLLPILSYHLLL